MMTDAGTGGSGLHGGRGQGWPAALHHSSPRTPGLSSGKKVRAKGFLARLTAASAEATRLLWRGRHSGSLALLGVTTENELPPSEAEQKWHAPARGPGTQQEQTEAPGNMEIVQLAPGWLRAKTEPAKGRQDDQRQHIPRTERESLRGEDGGDQETLAGHHPQPPHADRQPPPPAQEPELEASPRACPVGGQWKQQRGILCNSRNPLLGQTDPS